MSIAKPAFFFGAGNVANGGPAGPYVRKEARIRKGWTAFNAQWTKLEENRNHCGTPKSDSLGMESAFRITSR